MNKAGLRYVGAKRCVGVGLHHSSNNLTRPLAQIQFENTPARIILGSEIRNLLQGYGLVELILLYAG